MANTGKRGFGSMDDRRQREIARKGGQAAHAKGSAHEFSSEEARIAGSKGGRAAHARGSAHEFSSDEARAAGRKGGESSSQDRTRMAEIGRESGRHQPSKRRPRRLERDPRMGPASSSL